jgi:hypothetical protein
MPLLLLLGALLCSACVDDSADDASFVSALAETPSSVASALPGAERIAARVLPGSAPLWFEFGPNGPQQITSAEEASLIEFVPWPYARYAAGLELVDSGLVLAVNRWGFVALVPHEGFLLYSIPVQAWEEAYASSVFLYDGKAAVLLSGDDFFGAESAPPERCWFLDESDWAASDCHPRIFAAFAEGQWNLSSLFMGNDSQWYFQADGNETRYYRSPGLETPAEAVTTSLFRMAQAPYNSKQVPPVLQKALEAVSNADGPILLTVVSPAYPTVIQAAQAWDESGEDFTDAFAFYREGFAALVLGNGQGMIAEGEGLTIETRRFALPELPAGFVYTGLAFVENTIIAAWEERQDWNIAAAGCMIMTMEEK